MTRFFAAVVLAAGLALAGCGVPQQPGSEPGPDASTSGESPATADGPSTASSGSAGLSGGALAEQLDGRSFETRDAEDVRGFDLVPVSVLTISFGTDPQGNPSIGANAGCNGMGGSVTWDGDILRPSDGFFRTEMACEGLMEQEDWYLALLGDGVTLTLDGDVLTASDAAGTTEITYIDSSVLHPDVSLAGSTWRLTGLTQGSGDDGVAMSAPGHATASMMVSRDPADGHIRLDVFDGLTWMSVPGGFDAATGQYSGSVTIEPTDFSASGEVSDGEREPFDATAGTVRVTGGLAGDAIGCPAEKPDCRVAEMLLLGSDFEFSTHRDTLTVTGLGEYADRGLTFVVDPAAPTPPARPASSTG